MELPTELPDDLKKRVTDLRKRTSPKIVKQIIRDLCSLHPLKLAEIGAILGRHPRHIRDAYINEMVESQELEYVLPEPNHPHQAYRTKKP